MKYLNWIDLETTGLDEKEEGAKVLEIACVVTNRQLEEIDRISFPIKWDLPDEEISKWHHRVQQMHINNGLIYDCRNVAELTLEDVDEVVAAFIAENGPKGVLAGQSVAFDQRWLRHHMPRVTKALHAYHIHDVRTMITMAEGYDPEFKVKDLPGVYNHRAECDLDWSIGVATYIKDVYFSAGETED